MHRRHDRRHRLRSGLRSGTSVNLISMMDILTVLLLFLLKSYVAGGEVMVPPPGVQLPASTAEHPPQSTLVVAIDGDEILVGSEPVATIADAMGSPDPVIAPLAARLGTIRDQQDEIARLQGAAPPLQRVATIQGDRAIEFQVLKKVMLTLSRSGYEQIALAVLQKS